MNVPAPMNGPFDASGPGEGFAPQAGPPDRLIQLNRENRRLLAESADALVKLGTALDYLGRPSSNLKLGFAILERHWRLMGNLQVALTAIDDEIRLILQGRVAADSPRPRPSFADDPERPAGFSARARGFDSDN